MSSNYLVLGLPKSGKTTFLAVMAKYLQESTINSEIFQVTFPSDLKKRCNLTQQFVENNVRNMKNGHWPKKTLNCKEPYIIDIEKKTTILSCFSWTSVATFKYFDYPGEVLESPSDKEEDRDEELPDIEILRERLAEEISSARGIIVLVDYQDMQTRDRYEKTYMALSCLFALARKESQRLRNRIKFPASKTKLAIVFSKLELNAFHTDIKLENLIQNFKQLYPNSYSSLPPIHRFFDIRLLGNLDYTDDGEPIPPKEMETKGILELTKWLTNIDLLNS